MNLYRILLPLSIAASFLLTSCGSYESTDAETMATKNPALENPRYQTASQYYQEAYGKKGTELKKTLNNIIKGHRTLSYDGAWNALKETDADPSSPQNVILFYSRKSVSKNSNGGSIYQWNREHVWAKSHGNFGTSQGPGTDIHHLRPTNTVINSTRGSKEFAEGGSSFKAPQGFPCEGCYTTSSTFEPPDSVKGDTARIMFYMAVRYEGTDSYPDLELQEKSVGASTKVPAFGYLSTLIKWHLEDPVDDSERERNEIIYQKYQWNRNPFIDHPEFVTEIWKQGNY